MNFWVPHLASEIFASSDSVSEDGAGETLTSNRHKEQLKKSSNQLANSHGTNEIKFDGCPPYKKKTMSSFQLALDGFDMHGINRAIYNLYASNIYVS